MNFWDYLNARANRNVNVDALIGRTQQRLSYAYLILFAAVIGCLLFLPKPLEDSTKTLLITLLTVLGTLITQQSNFWYARARTNGVPDPTVTTTTQTTQTVTTPTDSTAPVLAVPPVPAAIPVSPESPPQGG